MFKTKGEAERRLADIAAHKKDLSPYNREEEIRELFVLWNETIPFAFKVGLTVIDLDRIWESVPWSFIKK